LGLNVARPPADTSFQLIRQDRKATVVDRAAQLLVEASAVEMTSPTGGAIEVWTIEAEGDVVTGSAPRLEVAEGMTLSCRMTIDDRAHQVYVLLEEATVKSQSRAAIRMRVVEAVADVRNRRSERAALSAGATLTAQVCDRLVPGEAVRTGLTDISETGFGAMVPGHHVRAGDRMAFYGRFMEGAVSSDIRVVRTSRRGADTHVGCMFIAPSPATTAVVGKVLERLSTTAFRPAADDLREALMPAGETSEDARALRRAPVPRFSPG
jgi:hypothetical protein